MGEKDNAAGGGGAYAPGTSDGPAGQTGGGGPSQAGPLNHRKANGNTMCGPDGKCIACGKPCDGGWDHEACGYDVQSWNRQVDDFYDLMHSGGASDKDIQKQFDDAWHDWQATDNPTRQGFDSTLTDLIGAQVRK